MQKSVHFGGKMYDYTVIERHVLTYCSMRNTGRGVASIRIDAAMLGTFQLIQIIP